MAKTAKAKQEHEHRAMLIANQMAEEYRTWFGWPEGSNFGRLVAIGEYIVELCAAEPHDAWLDGAKKSFLEWKKTLSIATAPPASEERRRPEMLP